MNRRSRIAGESSPEVAKLSLEETQLEVYLTDWLREDYQPVLDLLRKKG